MQMFALRQRPMSIPPIIDRIEVAAAYESGLVEVARRWPDAPVDAEAFAAHVRAHVGTQRDLSTMLPRLRIDELFLAWWAMTSSEGLAAFELELGDDLLEIASRFPHLDWCELIRALRETLFAGDAPRIAEYSGFGSLRGWVHVVATRTFLDVADLASRR
jgi:RNA polymerase sigma-70 factor, ECF subfamily